MMNNEYLVFKDADGTETKYPYPYLEDRVTIV